MQNKQKKEKMKTRTEINEIENIKTIGKNHQHKELVLWEDQ